MESRWADGSIANAMPADATEVPVATYEAHVYEVEQAFRYQKGNQDLAQRRSFFLGQVEPDAGAEAIDEPVSGLGADDVMAQPMGTPDPSRPNISMTVCTAVFDLRRHAVCYIDAAVLVAAPFAARAASFTGSRPTARTS